MIGGCTTLGRWMRRHLYSVFVKIVFFTVALQIQSGCSSLITASNKKLSGAKPTVSTPFSSVTPLPIPDGYTLADVQRELPYDLSLAIRDVGGPFAKRYGHETQYSAMLGATGSTMAAYHQMVSGPVADQVAEYLRRLNYFKRVTRDIESDTDLVFRIHLSQFEARSAGTTDMYMKMKLGLGDYETWTETQLTVQGSIAGFFQIEKQDGAIVLKDSFTIETGPLEHNHRSQASDNSRMTAQQMMAQAGTWTPPEIEALPAQLLARIRDQLITREQTLAALAGPLACTMAQARTPVGPIDRRFAVVVGLSRYQYASDALPNLNYADRDARAVCEFLMSSEAGSYKRENIKFLTNEDATYRNVRLALFEFLQKAIDQDFVLIFFSGHGLPDPTRPENLYLMCYDSDPAHAASTALPMRDLRAALAHHIEAERVLVLADACHSAGVAADGTRGVGVENNINRLLNQLSETRPGRLIFTSSEGYELSQESRRWGSGHGVFTWALLEALRGKADGYGKKEQDGIVTLGEMVEYTRDVVRRETSNAQHPAITGFFDRKLPMAVLSGHPSDTKIKAKPGEQSFSEDQTGLDPE